MKTGDRVKNLQSDLNILYKQYDIRYNRIAQYIESLSLQPGLELIEYPRGFRYEISDFICKTNILRITSDMIEKEKEIVNAVEAYVKLECYEEYKNNNLEKIFKKANEDEDTRLDILDIIDKFIFE